MARALRLLMFAPQFVPLSNPEAFVNAKLALAFQRRGWEVDIVSRGMAGVERYDYGADWSPQFAPLRAFTHETRYPVGPLMRRFLETAVGAVWTGHPIHGTRWAAHAIRLAHWLWSRTPYDAILSRAVPDSAHLPALVVGRRWGVPWVANWNDPSGKVSPPPYGTGPDAPVGLRQRRFLGAVVRGASRLTFPSPRLRDYMCQYLGGEARSKSIVIPHIGSGATQVGTRGGSNKFTVVYAGNITAERSLNAGAFLRAFKVFASGLSDRSTAEFVFMGIDRAGVVSRAAAELGSLVRAMGAVPYGAAQELLSRADLLLVLEARARESPFFPAKLVDYAEAGTPILAVTPHESTVGDYLRAHGGGAAVDGADEPGVVSVLRAHYDAWASRTVPPHGDSRALARQFDPERVTAIYAALFEELGLSTG